MMQSSSTNRFSNEAHRRSAVAPSCRGSREGSRELVALLLLPEPPRSSWHRLGPSRCLLQRPLRNSSRFSASGELRKLEQRPAGLRSRLLEALVWLRVVKSRSRPVSGFYPIAPLGPLNPHRCHDFNRPRYQWHGHVGRSCNLLEVLR